MTDIAALITRLRELQEQATPLPWQQSNDAVPWEPKQSPFTEQGAGIETVARDTERGHIFPEHYALYTIVVGGSQDEQGGAVGVLTNEDAAYLVTAANAAPVLAKEVERLQARIAELEQALKKYADARAWTYDLCGSNGGYQIVFVTAALLHNGNGWEIAEQALNGTQS